MAYNLPKFKGHFTFKDGYLLCPHCNRKTTSGGDEEMTLAAFYSEEGHDHDDNCLLRQYHCDMGHTVLVGLRRRCNTKDCEWVGKAECGCHDGFKVNEWPKRF